MRRIDVSITILWFIHKHDIRCSSEDKGRAKFYPGSSILGEKTEMEARVFRFYTEASERPDPLPRRSERPDPPPRDGGELRLYIQVSARRARRNLPVGQIHF
jgi:hypothetical protein